MAVLRATVIRLRLLRVFRTLEGSFGPIMNTMAEGAAAAAGGVVSIAATSAAVRAGSRAWFDKAGFNTGGSRCIPLFACACDIPTSGPCTS